MLRRATPADLPLLARMNHALIRDEGSANPMTVAELETRMRGFLRDGYAALVVEADRTDAGYALFRPNEGGIHLRQLYVLPEWRRRGVGRAAVAILRRDVFPAGARVTVEVLVGNERGLAFWRAVGFADHAVVLQARPA